MLIGKTVNALATLGNVTEGGKIVGKADGGEKCMNYCTRSDRMDEHEADVLREPFLRAFTYFPELKEYLTNNTCPPDIVYMNDVDKNERCSWGCDTCWKDYLLS